MGYYGYSSRAEMAADAGLVYSREHRGYIDPDDYCRECGSHKDYCECDRESGKTCKVVIARKDRTRVVRYVADEAGKYIPVRETYIRKGDKVRVESYFTYQRGGARTGYHHSYSLIAKGPNWPVAA